MSYTRNPDRSDRRDHDFERSVRPLLGSLHGAALRLTRNRADADDLVQEAVLRAWRFWNHYEPNTNLRAWLQRILRNAFVNRYRRARRERELLAQAHSIAAQRAPEVEPAAMRASLSDEVERGLGELPRDFRAVLWAVDVDELSYREAAESLACPIGTVMSRLHRARAGLGQALQPYAAAQGYRLTG
jgi:RNA polymerase sigma-70 factor (ECF subfamily)